MDHEQFGGRTDDDLFSDDIEPVDEYTSLPTVAQTASLEVPSQIEPGPAPPLQQPEPTAAPPPPAPRSSLAQSRHAPRQQDKPRHSSNSNANAKRPPTETAADNPASQETRAASSGTSTPPTTGSTTNHHPNNTNNHNNNRPPINAPREPSSAKNNNNNNTASAASAARLSSGANPRTKLTEAELAARMEKMRLLAAEKTRRFEEAQRDESEHAAALAKGLEDARRRRAEDAARRRQQEEERRRLDEERARNRERKLASMAAKEGGSWDEGKEEREERGFGGGAFRGAFGGVRGARAGLGGSRFASSSGDDRDGGEYDGFVGGRGRGGRGRGGRGGRGGGRGGRGLFEYEEREAGQGRDRGRDAVAAQEMRTGGPGQLAPKKVDLKSEDFPALPSSSAGPAPKKLDTAWAAKPNSTMADIPLSPPVGKWDEEMAAVENKEGTS